MALIEEHCQGDVSARRELVRILRLSHSLFPRHTMDAAERAECNLKPNSRPATFRILWLILYLMNLLNYLFVSCKSRSVLVFSLLSLSPIVGAELRGDRQLISLRHHSCVGAAFTVNGRYTL